MCAPDRRDCCATSAAWAALAGGRAVAGGRRAAAPSAGAAAPVCAARDHLGIPDTLRSGAVSFAELRYLRPHPIGWPAAWARLRIAALGAAGHAHPCAGQPPVPAVWAGPAHRADAELYLLRAA